MCRVNQTEPPSVHKATANESLKVLKQKKRSINEAKVNLIAPWIPVPGIVVLKYQYTELQHHPLRKVTTSSNKELLEMKENALKDNKLFCERISKLRATFEAENKIKEMLAGANTLTILNKVTDLEI